MTSLNKIQLESAIYNKDLNQTETLSSSNLEFLSISWGGISINLIETGVRQKIHTHYMCFICAARATTTNKKIDPNTFMLFVFFLDLIRFDSQSQCLWGSLFGFELTKVKEVTTEL